MAKKFLVLILALGVITVAAFSCMRPEGKEITEEPDITAEADEAAQTETGVKTYCFFGLDTRTPDDRGRSDVIMLIRVDNEAEDMKVVSVYRDTLMEMGGLAKANAAYAYGGPNYAVDTLENNLDLDIDGYVSADFKAVIDIINILGGVTLDVTDEEAGYANSYISEMNDLYKLNSAPLGAGTQTLDGVQAVGYARVRYTEGWDYKRTERQRTLLGLMAEKFREADDETQNAVLDKFFSEFYTDMTEADVSNMVDHVMSYEVSENAGFPKYKKGVSIASLGSCVAPSDLEKTVKWLHEFLYGDTEYEPSEEVRTIGGTISGAAGE